MAPIALAAKRSGNDEAGQRALRRARLLGAVTDAAENLQHAVRPAAAAPAKGVDNQTKAIALALWSAYRCSIALKAVLPPAGGWLRSMTPTTASKRAAADCQVPIASQGLVTRAWLMLGDL